jgi:hypothetical protein
VGTELSISSAPPVENPADVEATYKSREVEGIVDLVFYRPIGFHIARFFARLNVTPTTVTLIGGLFGVIAGHFYLYRQLALNLFGMLLHVIANAFDNADGQLARMTNQQTRTGRILDPIVDHIVWLSIYLHLVLRLHAAGHSNFVWLLALTAGISHGLQAGAADYWRNAYFDFGKGRGELDSVATLKQEYRNYSWRDTAWSKFLLRLNLNAMHQQELLMPGVKRLHKITERDLGAASPAFRARYSALALPTFKWWSLLMTNTRMLVLLIVFLFHEPIWFFWFELIAGNLLLLYLIVRQQKISNSLVQFLNAQEQGA